MTSPDSEQITTTEKSTIQAMRIAREVKTYKNGKSDYALTLFLGLYNAEKYLAGLKVQILNQKSNNFNLLIVDNASTDNTWLQLENFISDIDVPITLVKNPLNLGSTGSQVLNFDLLNSDWFAFIHQDDYYSPNHVKTLAKEIDNAHEGVIAISTLMGSKLPNGKKSSDPPRAIWLVPSTDPQTTFLANVRQHTVPWPSTAFRTKPFIECLPPWHGTAFPDTEIILKLCARGKFHQIEKVTMSYTENPDSESHSINEVERVIGATASLARIFTSPEFIEISKGVPQGDRKEFSEALQNAITARIGNGPLNEMLWLIANETLLIAWEYSNSINLSNTSELYSQIGAERPSNLLDSLNNSGFVSNSEVAKSPDLKFEASLLPGIIQKKPKSDSLALPSALQRVVNLGLKILPHNIERLLVTKLIRLKVKSNPIHPWNFRWR